MTSIINASVSSNGIVSTADASGILNIQSNGVNTNAQAWVNWNGTSGASPVVRASYNISSITRSATGTYVISFTNSFVDVNYAIVLGGSNSTSTTPPTTAQIVSLGAYLPTSTSSVTVVTLGGGSSYDVNYCTLAVFR